MNVVKIWGQKKREKKKEGVTKSYDVRHDLAERKGRRKGKKGAMEANTPLGYQLAQSIKRDLC